MPGASGERYGAAFLFMSAELPRASVGAVTGTAGKPPGLRKHSSASGVEGIEPKARGDRKHIHEPPGR